MLDPQLASQVTVAAAGEPSKITVEKVKRDVFHSPPLRCRGSSPLPRRELIEKSEQVRTLLTKKCTRPHWRRRPYVHTPASQRVTDRSLIGHVRMDRGHVRAFEGPFRKLQSRCLGAIAGRRCVIAQPARVLEVVVRTERGCSGMNPSRSPTLMPMMPSTATSL